MRTDVSDPRITHNRHMRLATRVVGNGFSPLDIGIAPTNKGINECQKHRRVPHPPRFTFAGQARFSARYIRYDRCDRHRKLLLERDFGGIGDMAAGGRSISMLEGSRATWRSRGRPAMSWGGTCETDERRETTGDGDGAGDHPARPLCRAAVSSRVAGRHERVSRSRAGITGGGWGRLAAGTRTATSCAHAAAAARVLAAGKRVGG